MSNYDELKAEVESVIARYSRVWPVPYELSANLKLLTHVMSMLAVKRECLCDVGAQTCPLHPRHLYTIDQRFDFERAWDRTFKEKQNA